MTAAATEKRFVRRIRELLVSLPYDMKVLFEAISDENLPVEARQLAAGTAIYCLSPSDPIPDTLGLLGYVDDVIVVRLALKRFLEFGEEDVRGGYTERFMDQFKSLDEDLELFKAYLGESMDWLQGRMDKTLIKTKYKGKDSLSYTMDEEAREFLYEEGQAFTTHYEIDDKAAVKLQSGKPVLDTFRRRMAEESRMMGEAPSSRS